MWHKTKKALHNEVKRLDKFNYFDYTTIERGGQ
nr:MAG TPA: hypothetical protein [Caudoviricetes sp.]